MFKQLKDVDSLLDELIDIPPILSSIAYSTKNEIDFIPILEYSISKNSFKSIKHFDLLIPQSSKTEIDFSKLIKNINFKYLDKEEDRNELDKFSYLINFYKKEITDKRDLDCNETIIDYLSLLNQLMTIFHNSNIEYNYKQSENTLIDSNYFIFEYINSLILLLAKVNHSTSIIDKDEKKVITSFITCSDILKEIENQLKIDSSSSSILQKKEEQQYGKLLYIKSPTSLSNDSSSSSSYQKKSNYNIITSTNVINNNEIFSHYFGDKVIINSLVNYFKAKIYETVFKTASESLVNLNNYELNKEANLDDKQIRDYINKNILNSMYSIHSCYKQSFKLLDKNYNYYGLYKYCKLLNHYWSIRKHYVHTQYILNSSSFEFSKDQNKDQLNKIALKHLETIIIKHDNINKWIDNLSKESKQLESIINEYNTFYQNCRVLYDDIDKKVKSKYDTTEGIKIDSYILDTKLQKERSNEFSNLIQTRFSNLSKKTNNITKSFTIFNNILIKHNQSKQSPSFNPFLNISNDIESSPIIKEDCISYNYILKERIILIDCFLDYLKTDPIQRKGSELSLLLLVSSINEIKSNNELSKNIKKSIIKERMNWMDWMSNYFKLDKNNDIYYQNTFIKERKEIEETIQYNNLYFQ